MRQRKLDVTKMLPRSPATTSSDAETSASSFSSALPTNIDQTLTQLPTQRSSLHAAEINFAGDHLAGLKRDFSHIRQQISAALDVLWAGFYLPNLLHFIQHEGWGKILIPTFMFVALCYGEPFASAWLSQQVFGSDRFEFLVPLVLALSELTYSANHNRSDERMQGNQFLLAAAADMWSIYSLSTSVYEASLLGLSPFFNAKLVNLLSLANGGFVIPLAFTNIVKYHTKHNLRIQRQRGAQRNDTALLAAGLTPVSNLFFVTMSLLQRQFQASDKIFQLFLLGSDISTYEQVVKQAKNLPSLLTVLLPQLIRELREEQKRLDSDYQKNQQKCIVLRESEEHHWEQVEIPICRLKTGDLVWCQSLNLLQVPISGILVRKPGILRLPSIARDGKCSISLKGYTGEDRQITLEPCAEPAELTALSVIEQDEILKGTYPGVMTGCPVSLAGCAEWYCIQVMPQEQPEISLLRNAILSDQVIGQAKLKTIRAAILMAALYAHITPSYGSTVKPYLWRALRLLLASTQMMVPLAEPFLRNLVNTELLAELNRKTTAHYNAAVIGDIPPVELDTLQLRLESVLRIASFIDVASGLHAKEYPGGVVIESDKTGTLTTNRMLVRGVWHPSLASDAQALIDENAHSSAESTVMSRAVLEKISDAFIMAHTCSGSAEPEEEAFLEFLKQQMTGFSYQAEEGRGLRSFKKHFSFEDANGKIHKATFSTTHYPQLFAACGGRLTVVCKLPDSNDQTAQTQYFAVVCGVPNKRVGFKDCRLAEDYYRMQPRLKDLTRDWVVARAEINQAQYEKLRLWCVGSVSCEEARQNDILQYLQETQILARMELQGTMLIDNPVKPHAEKFIGSMREAGIRVIVATGDTRKAALVIARILDAQRISSTNAVYDLSDPNHLTPVRRMLALPEGRDQLKNAALIFSGWDPALANDLLTQLIAIPVQECPTIIFSGMKVAAKGDLARFLKEKCGCFVVANGDGENDRDMMQAADLVVTHSNDQGSIAGSIARFSDLTDLQLRALFDRGQAFYEIFNSIAATHEGQFFQAFHRVANAQYMPFYALGLKAVKISFDLARESGLQVTEPSGQVVGSMLFDLAWLAISFQQIIQNADLPPDRYPLGQSKLFIQVIVGATALANLAAGFFCEAWNQATPVWLFGSTMLALLPRVLHSFFNAYQNGLPVEIRDERNRAKGGLSGLLFPAPRPQLTDVPSASPVREQVAGTAPGMENN